MQIQVLDVSAARRWGRGHRGGVRRGGATINASKKPGEWQVHDRYEAPRFDAAGNKTANFKLLRVVLNGTLLHENLELKGPTPGGLTGKEAETGPILFQGNHGPVAYRNIRVSPLKCLTCEMEIPKVPHLK
jgi:hypothetical protein